MEFLKDIGEPTPKERDRKYTVMIRSLVKIKISPMIHRRRGRMLSLKRMRMTLLLMELPE